MNAGGTWILVRGLGREARHWGPFVKRFRAAFAQAEVRAPDLPGCGLHHRTRAPTRVADLLAAVRAEALVGQEGATAPEPFGLLGISLGAMVVCEWMRRHPEEVARAVLINGSAGDLSAPWARLRPRAAVRLLCAGFSRDRRARERWIYRITSARPENEDAVSAEWEELARSCPVSPANVGRQLLAASRFRLGVLPRLPPVLLLVGARDGLVDPACSAALAGPLRAEVRTHPGAGHDLTLDAPDWAVEQVVSWHRLQEAVSWHRKVTL